MRRPLFLLIIVFVIACGTEEPNLTVSGEVKGLKKGTLYLERIIDTSLVVIDSLVINGTSEFVLQTSIKEPEVLHLSLDNYTDGKRRISFFASEGTTSINTTLKRFVFDATIEGSEQQKLLEEFNTMIAKFNDQSLDLIKAQLEAQQDSLKIDSLQSLSNNLLKRKYLYAINYALNNKNSEVAPYIALASVYDANIKYLDTIYNSLPEPIAKSKYGKELYNHILKQRETTGQ